MSGTLSGGKEAARTNKFQYGEDFYVRIGAKGGSAKVPKGMSMNRELARRAGSIGGRKSKPYSKNPRRKK